MNSESAWIAAASLWERTLRAAEMLESGFGAQDVARYLREGAANHAPNLGIDPEAAALTGTERIEKRQQAAMDREKSSHVCRDCGQVFGTLSPRQGRCPECWEKYDAKMPF